MILAGLLKYMSGLLKKMETGLLKKMETDPTGLLIFC